MLKENKEVLVLAVVDEMKIVLFQNLIITLIFHRMVLLKVVENYHLLPRMDFDLEVRAKADIHVDQA
jgi:hypothetical protein